MRPRLQRPYVTVYAVDRDGRLKAYEAYVGPKRTIIRGRLVGDRHLRSEHLYGDRYDSGYSSTPLAAWERFARRQEREAEAACDALSWAQKQLAHAQAEIVRLTPREEQPA